jgi:hypothetical protein
VGGVVAVRCCVETAGVKPTRTTQPYRTGARHPGPALTAMLKGRTTSGWNPKDVERVQLLMRAGKRPPRPVRPQRPQRPAR